MNVLKCLNGHFYDSDKNSVCPICKANGFSKQNNIAQENNEIMFETIKGNMLGPRDLYDDGGVGSFVAEDPVDIKKELITAFHDTQRTSTSPGLNIQTAKMIRNSKIYGEEFWKGKEKRSNLNSECEIIVEENTSFSAAKKYLPFGRTAVLNFANPVTPGGGVQYGAMAQEECLCRSSNLYEALSSKVMDEYYNYHLEMDSIYASDRLIYSPKVTVFKDDSQVPKLMPKNEWFSVDVITCAAPYNNHADMVYKEIIPDLLKETFKRRIKNIFEAALDNQIEVIILGAFGCGAFRNPPELVASAFHEVIDENQYKKYFSKIVFAIKRSCEPPCPNLMAFEREFLLFSPEGNYERFYM